MLESAVDRFVIIASSNTQQSDLLVDSIQRPIERRDMLPRLRIRGAHSPDKTWVLELITNFWGQQGARGAGLLRISSIWALPVQSHLKSLLNVSYFVCASY